MLREGVLNMHIKSDIEIAREAKKSPIQDIGAKIGIPSHLGMIKQKFQLVLSHLKVRSQMEN